MIGAIREWGSTAEERALDFACDRVLTDPDDVCFRAVDVQAPADVVFRWLCQLKAAPYSYDWIDNFGRTSPRFLVPGLEELAVGQHAMRVFELRDFEPGRQLTFALRHPSRLFGRVAVTYMVCGIGTRRSRIVVKLAIRYPASFASLRRRLPVTAEVLLLGDLVMMRRQLHNLRDLAEGSSASAHRTATTRARRGSAPS